MTVPSPSILVAEDQRGLREPLVANLEDRGYRVVGCETGGEALRCVRDDAPDIVIADLRLPDVGGLEILETLKEVKPEAAFIVMTGHASLETAVEALNEGAFAYVTKPFNMDQVYTIVNSALKQQRLLRENQMLVETLQQSNSGLNEELVHRRRAEDALAQKAEELARSNADLEQFAYVASHDLQEPLRMVANYTQLLKRRYQGRLDHDADDFITYAVDGAQRMQELIDDLLEFSRVASRKHDFEAVDCNEALDRAVRNLGVAIAESDALVTHGPLGAVQADPSQISQLFQNLIGNALKYRRRTRPEVNIESCSLEGERLFSVADNGVGIQSTHLERIFAIFQRLHTREEYPGTGIGLAICKKIVERHRGRIWAESEVGSGSTFYFTLPDGQEQ